MLLKDLAELLDTRNIESKVLGEADQRDVVNS